MDRYQLSLIAIVALVALATVNPNFGTESVGDATKIIKDTHQGQNQQNEVNNVQTVLESLDGQKQSGELCNHKKECQSGACKPWCCGELTNPGPEKHDGCCCIDWKDTDCPGGKNCQCSTHQECNSLHCIKPKGQEFGYCGDKGNPKEPGTPCYGNEDCGTFRVCCIETYGQQGVCQGAITGCNSEESILQQQPR